MSPNGNVTRRKFLGRAGRGAAALAAVPAIAPALSFTGSPNETVRLGHIGLGVRGGTLISKSSQVDGVKIVAVCDVYKPHLEKGVERSLNPDVRTYVDYQDLLADKSVDAVVIATPDHWHSKMLIDAANAGKDVYIEKGWTRTIAEAKAMRASVKKSGIVMQLGHQAREKAPGVQAAGLIRTGILGPLTLVRTGRFANTPKGHGVWRWYGGYGQFERPDPAQVKRDLDWKRWLGSIPYRPFSMEDFWHWRCYWRYGTGVAGDLLSHEMDFVQSILRLGIPDACSTAGLNALLKDGREVPDTWNAIFHFEKAGVTVTFDSSMNSTALGQTPTFHGKDAVLRFDGIAHNVTTFEVHADPVSGREGIIAEYDPSKMPPMPGHMEDFIQCVRNRGKPRCNEDEAFIEVATLVLSVRAYKEQRQVRWDPEKQDVV